MRKYILSCIFLFVICSLLNAQNREDTELWSGATIKLKLSKKFRFDVEEQFRFNENISNQRVSLTEFGLRYRLNNQITFKTNYRYIVRPDKNNRWRINVDANYEWDQKDFPLTIKYRLRLQDEKEANSGNKFTELRNRFVLDYNLSKLTDPFLAFEIFYRFNDKNEFRKTRYTMGLDWKVTKDVDLETYFRIQKDINVNNPETKYIIGLMLSYNLDI